MVSSLDFGGDSFNMFGVIANLSLVRESIVAVIQRGLVLSLVFAQDVMHHYESYGFFNQYHIYL
jgi:hypothetical protein